MLRTGNDLLAITTLSYAQSVNITGAVKLGVAATLRVARSEYPWYSRESTCVRKKLTLKDIL